MGIKKYGPYTPSRRNMTGSDFSEITKKTPEKSLLVSKNSIAGRNNQGKITVRHRGGGGRRKYRIIDFKRYKDDCTERATCSPLTVSRVEKGAPTVAIGIYLRILYALQLDDDILAIAKDDALGRTLQDVGLKYRERASKKE